MRARASYHTTLLDSLPNKISTDLNVKKHVVVDAFKGSDASGHEAIQVYIS